MIEIDRVQLAEPFRLFENASFDLPSTGRIDVVAFRVAGWFRRPRGAPNVLVRLTLAASEGAEPPHVNLRQVRPQERVDVPCKPWEIALGFDAFVDAVTLPRTFRILISYQRESGEDCPLGEIHGRRTVLPGQYASEFQPVIVGHAGRMGSTAMMRALLAHPGIAVDDRHPYENGSAAYFARASSVFLRTDERLEDMDLVKKWPWHSVRPNYSLSPNFQTYESIDSALAALAGPVADFARARIDDYYRLIRARTTKPGSTLFAEKVVWADTINIFLWLYPNVKLIMLTRDPRDVFRSARDFNAKRALIGFGRELAESDEEWIDLRAKSICGFVDIFDDHPEDDRLHVRFEDFMADTRGTMNRVCAFLKLDDSKTVLDAIEHAVREETPQSRLHRTSSPGQEVGGWRHGLTPEHAARIVKRMRPFMRRFGYAADLDQVPDVNEPVLSKDRPNTAGESASRAPFFVSYSANFEDVILRRLFPERRTGFYVDVGAAHPTDENDTKALYDAGWRGINIEPNETFFDVLNAERPRDANVRAALSDRVGTIAYYEVVGTGLSTCDQAFADRARQNGHQVIERSVPVATLADILKDADPPAIDLLKIDVEGLEQEVLQGNDWARYRPSVILVEATFPESAVRRPTAIREYLAERRYAWKYFDGLNDFYVAEEFSYPQHAFESPPNIFDRFKPRAIAELEKRNAALAAEAAAAGVDAAEKIRQRDEIERASDAAVRFGREQELRANRLDNRLAKLEAHAQAVERGRDEAERYAKSLEGALADRDAALRQAETYVASLKAHLASAEKARGDTN